MSTKIHNGYILIDGANPFAFLRGLRAELDPVRDRLDATLIAELIAARIDRHIAAGEPVPDDVVVDVYLEWEKEQDGLKDHDRGKDPNSFEACIGEDPVTGRHHLLAFTERPEYHRVLEGMGALREYGYWNNTDRPKDVTSADWEARSAAWARVMPSGVPVESMLTFTHRGKYSPGIISLIGDRSPLVLENAKSPLERARAVVVNRAGGKAMAERGMDNFGAISRALRRLQRSAGGWTPRLAAHLPELTWEAMFSGRPADPAAAEALEADAAELLERTPLED